MKKLDIESLISIAPENDKVLLKKNIEIQRKIKFLSEKGTRISELYKRMIYNEKERDYYDLDEKEFSHYQKFKGTIHKILGASTVSTLTSSLLYLNYGKNLNIDLYVGIWISSAVLYGVSMALKKVYNKGLGGKLVGRPNNLINALDDIYLIESKEYKNAL